MSDGFVMPDDDDDWAELRLEAVRLIYRGRPDATPEQQAAGYYMLRGSDVERLFSGERLMYGQLRILQESGVLVCNGWRLGDTDTMHAELTSDGAMWALRGDGRKSLRARRRILRHMLRQSDGAADELFEAEDVATALNVQVTDVGRAFAVLEHMGCVGTFKAFGDCFPMQAYLTPFGVQVAEDGWNDFGGNVSHSQHIAEGDNASIGGIAQGGHDVTQHVTMSTGGAELRQVLDRLTEAIRGLDRTVEHRAAALAAARQVAASVCDPDRDTEEVSDNWTWLGRFADALAAAGAVGAPTTVKALYDQAAPLVRPLLQLGGG